MQPWVISRWFDICFYHSFRARRENNCQIKWLFNAYLADCINVVMFQFQSVFCWLYFKNTEAIAEIRENLSLLIFTWKPKKCWNWILKQYFLCQIMIVLTSIICKEMESPGKKGHFVNCRQRSVLYKFWLRADPNLALITSLNCPSTNFRNSPFPLPSLPFLMVLHGLKS